MGVVLEDNSPVVVNCLSLNRDTTTNEWWHVMFLYFLDYDSRQTIDRRSGKPARFPLKESDGQLVLFDRRYQPDRRSNSFPAKIACRTQPGFGYMPGVFVGSAIRCD